MRYVTAALVISLLLALLVLVSRVVGAHLHPPPAPLQHADFCVLPCWRGINPGQTRIDPANRIMLGQGYIAQNTTMNRARIRYLPGATRRGECVVQLDHREAIVTENRLSDCPGLTLGDVMATLGGPDGIEPGALSLTFAGGRVRVKLEADGCARRLLPTLPVRYISLTPGTSTAKDIPWQGFKPPRYYLPQVTDVLLLTC